MIGNNLGALRSDEAKQAALSGAVVLIPVGAFEQHGPHLPLDVDINLSQAVAERVSAGLDNVHVAPAVSWGLSASHMSFPGTITLRPETMLALLVDIASSLIQHGLRRLVFVDFHMSNRPLVTIAIREILQRSGVAVLHVFCSDFAAETFEKERVSPIGGELHAGEFETSVELYLRPDLVQMGRAVTNLVDPKRHFNLSDAPADMFHGGLVQVGIDLCSCAPDGVMGDPTVATPELGERLVTAMVEGITNVVEEFLSVEARPDATSLTD